MDFRKVTPDTINSTKSYQIIININPLRS
jgi:hypothetical protein